MKLKIDFENKKDELVVNLYGDLDINTTDEFKNTIINKIENQVNLNFNCEKLEYIDSMGLGAFISVYKNLKEKNGNLVIKNLKPHLKKIFIITDLDKVFKIEE